MKLQALSQLLARTLQLGHDLSRRTNERMVASRALRGAQHNERRVMLSLTSSRNKDYDTSGFTGKIQDANKE